MSRKYLLDCSASGAKWAGEVQAFGSEVRRKLYGDDWDELSAQIDQNVQELFSEFSASNSESR